MLAFGEEEELTVFVTKELFDRLCLSKALSDKNLHNDEGQ